jgi:hypothetical protein
MNDENSPPAKFSELIGLSRLIRNFSEDFAKPSHDKLLPDWSQVRVFRQLPWATIFLGGSRLFEGQE